MTFTEEFKLKGGDILQRIKEILKEGNVRRLTVKNKNGKVLFDTTATIGAVGAGSFFLLAPLIATIAAVLLLVNEVSVVVEKEDDNDKHEVFPSTQE